MTRVLTFFGLTLTVALLCACTRLGFPAAHDGPRDGASIVDGGGVDAVGPGSDATPDTFDAAGDTGHDTQADGAFDGGQVDGASDSLLDGGADTTDATNGYLRLFSLQNHSTGIAYRFTPSATKTGLPLRWELGDGTVVDSNTVSHVYSQTGTKTVHVLSADGPAGITQLHVSGDVLTESIPLELGQLTNLTRLSLDSNRLSGNIPPELGQLTSLTQLHLFSNSLSGSIPLELGQLT
ncbi:MAG: hypothetical protein JRH20_01965, partial [Deltaproteobacteria bacterium]|nr:hypothetical protein [Deltaproteobacteria bacterium]